MAPRLIPVVDVMDGQVVRAVGGRRTDYRPLVSRLVHSTDPFTVATAMLQATGASELYLADLDAIQGKHGFGWRLIHKLEQLNVTIWWDGGFGPDRPIPDLQGFPFLRPVLGFETCKTPDVLKTALSHVKPDRIAFSVDLIAGKLFGGPGLWGIEEDPVQLAREVIHLGSRHLIVLDLARVGLAKGCGTEDVLHVIHAESPEIDLIAGGGIGSTEDIQALGAIGVNAVLIASAVHNRMI